MNHDNPTGFDEMTAEIVAYIQEHQDTPWRIPWSISGNPPMNLYTGTVYRGINAMRLLMAGFSYHLWATRKQIARMGGSITSGEKPTRIVVRVKQDSKKMDQETKSGSFGPPGGGSNIRLTPVVNQGAFVIIPIYLYNIIGQTTGVEIDILHRLDLGEKQPCTMAEDLLAGYPDPVPEVRYGRMQPSYTAHDDVVYMPEQSQFRHTEVFWSTLFHEIIGHAVWNDRRPLTRQHPRAFLVLKHENLEQYCFMELIAELTAWYAAGWCGLTTREERTDSATYLNEYIKFLEGERGTRLFQNAITYAQHGFVYVLGENKAKQAGLLR